MKLFTLLAEQELPVEDPFALMDEPREREGSISDGNNWLQLDPNEPIDTDLQNAYFTARAREYGWNSIRSGIEEQVASNHIIMRLEDAHPGSTNKFARGADHTNRLDVGVYSYDMNVMPDKLKPWIIKLAARAKHASDQSEIESQKAQDIVKKLFAKKAAMTRAANKAKRP